MLSCQDYMHRAAPDCGWVQSARLWGRPGAARRCRRAGLVGVIPEALGQNMNLFLLRMFFCILILSGLTSPAKANETQVLKQVAESCADLSLSGPQLIDRFQSDGWRELEDVRPYFLRSAQSKYVLYLTEDRLNDTTGFDQLPARVDELADTLVNNHVNARATIAEARAKGKGFYVLLSKADKRMGELILDVSVGPPLLSCTLYAEKLSWKDTCPGEIPVTPRGQVVPDMPLFHEDQVFVSKRMRTLNEQSGATCMAPKRNLIRLATGIEMAFDLRIEMISLGRN